MGEDGGSGGEGGKGELLRDRILDLTRGEGSVGKGLGGKRGVKVEPALEGQWQV